MVKRKLSELEGLLGYHFQNQILLENALTHTSFVNEHKEWVHGSNERLEFLGDAILDFIAAEYLCENHPDLSEGDLSTARASMVSEKPLAAAAHDLGLPSFLKLGKGEEKNGGRKRDSLLADAVEACIAAVYLDGGFEAAKTLVREKIFMDLGAQDLFQDKKTPLQEFFQDRKKQVVYRVAGESGPAHAKVFTVEAVVDGHVIGTGSGSTKKAAAQNAAEQAMSELRNQTGT